MRALLPFLLLFGSQSVSAQVQQERFPVAINLVGDDGLTQNLQSELRTAVQKNPALRIAAIGDERPLLIESDSNVDWDKLSGREIAIYIVFVTSGEAKRVLLVGACWENELSKCARDIVERASRFIPPRTR